MKQKNNNIVLTRNLRTLFDTSWQQYRVIYFSAPCGVGKTSAAHVLLSNYCVYACSANAPEFLSLIRNADSDVILIDDFQCLTEPEEKQAVCELINTHPNSHFVFLSRSVLPGWLMPYRFTGLLTTIDAQAMRFDRTAVRELASANDVMISEQEIKAILIDTEGYPLFVALICRQLVSGKSYTAELLEQAQCELFRYVEEAVYHRFSASMRALLITLAPFDPFDAELAKLVSGDSHVNDLLGQILHETTMLDSVKLDNYRFWPIFREFLLWEMIQDCTVEKQHDIYRRAGLYYELHDEYAHALDCYTRCGAHDKVSELLVKNSERQAGAANYYEMEQYYYALPREEVLRSPVLMCGMSMLTSLCLDYEASEQWYAELQNYAARLRKTDTNYKIAKTKLLYLDIALPQRGSRGLLEIIGTVFKAMKDKQMTIPQFSVTSMLPSVMNGGKDFCDWSKKDDLLYVTMRIPLETVLNTAQEYRFIQPVAQYGAAILPLLNASDWKNDLPYLKKLLAATRVQTVNYPDFLRPPVALTEPLSKAETQVLKLLCHNRSNQEIADILGVKLPTVKTQVRSILQKLGVTRRSEAKDAAQTLHLL